MKLHRLLAPILAALLSGCASLGSLDASNQLCTGHRLVRYCMPLQPSDKSHGDKVASEPIQYLTLHVLNVSTDSTEPPAGDVLISVNASTPLPLRPGSHREFNLPLGRHSIGLIQGGSLRNYDLTVNRGQVVHLQVLQYAGNSLFRDPRPRLRVLAS